LFEEDRLVDEFQHIYKVIEQGEIVMQCLPDIAGFILGVTCEFAEEIGNHYRQHQPHDPFLPAHDSAYSIDYLN
jgi:hypothetical protein